MPRQITNGHQGYDPSFLGQNLARPTLKSSMLAKLVSGAGNEITYTHFSVFVDKDRKMPIMTAVNIKGEAYTKVTREGNDPWTFSDQINKEFQIDNTFYANDDNTFDRGHLVRRIDPCWGGFEIATAAENETFRWVNCTPQNKKLNQKGGAWYQLEQHVMENGVKNKLADITVFSGPVLNPNDKVFIKLYKNSEVQIPVLYWKVIVWEKANNKLNAVGFMMDQSEWVKQKLKAPAVPLAITKKALARLPDDYFENLKFNDNKTYQVRLQDIELATGIKFDWPGVELPFKARQPKAVHAAPLKNVYTFDVYLKTKVRLASQTTATPQRISRGLISKGHTALSKASIAYSLGNGYGGILRQYEISNISL